MFDNFKILYYSILFYHYKLIFGFFHWVNLNTFWGNGSQKIFYESGK